MAAYTSGRTQISRYDCLLLKHVLWQQPDEARRIEEWLLKNLATSDGVGQSEYLFQGCPLLTVASLHSLIVKKVAVEAENQHQDVGGHALGSVSVVMGSIPTLA